MTEPDRIDLDDPSLYESVESPSEHEARRSLLEHLAAAGVGVEQLRRAVAEDRLVLLPVEVALSEGERFTLDDVARMAGLPIDFLLAISQALGRPRPAADERVFSERDLEVARVLKRFRDAGLPAEGILEVARVLGQGMANTAAAVRRLVGEAFLQSGVSEHDLGLRYAQAAVELEPLMEPLLTHQLRMHMREGVRRDVISRAERTEGRLAGSREVSVAFADLVGFTRLGEKLPAEDLGGIATRLSELAAVTVGPPVQLIKTIGDAAMLVSPDAGALLETVFELLAAADGEGEEFPDLRAGLAIGPALTRAGDWYGAPVNTASRVTQLARPGSVLATEAVRDVARDRCQWSAAGRRRLRGVRQPVALYRARPLAG